MSQQPTPDDDSGRQQEEQQGLAECWHDWIHDPRAQAEYQAWLDAQENENAR